MNLKRTGRAAGIRSGVIMAFLLGFFLIAMLSDPRAAEAAIGVLDAWPATPQITGGATASFSGTFTIGSGSNRLLVVAVMPGFTGNPSSQSVSVTYGGRALTQVNVSDVAQRRYTWIGYLKEADIASRSGDTVQVTLANATSLSGTNVYLSSYTGVDQTAPVTASGNNYINNSNSPVALAAAVAVNAGGFGVFAFHVNNANNPADSGTDAYAFTNGTQSGTSGNYSRVAARAFVGAATTNSSVSYGAAIRAGVVGVTLNPAPAAGPGILQLSSSTYSGNENDGSVTITATRTGGSTGAVGVSYSTANGTAASGSDYTAASSTLSWADGDTANKTFTVSITNDATVEGNETFTVTLSGATGGAGLGSPSSGTVTIVDDDGGPPAQVPAGNGLLFGALAAGIALYAARKNRRKSGNPAP